MNRELESALETIKELREREILLLADIANLTHAVIHAKKIPDSDGTIIVNWGNLFQLACTHYNRWIKGGDNNQTIVQNVNELTVKIKQGE